MTPEQIPDISITNDYGRKVLDLVTRMGQTLLLNGAEIARVQTTMEMVAKAYNKDEIDVFAISNGIFVTLRHEDKTRCTQIKHVPLHSPNLGKVAMINQLSREIVASKISLDDALSKMDEIVNAPAISLPLAMSASALGAACFCYLLGGNLYDSLATLSIGVILCVCQYVMRLGKLSKMLQTILGSVLVTLCGFLLSSLFPILNMDNMIIGGLIILVPGVPFTTSIRDFFNGDYLSGTIRMIDAILVAFCMAIGVGLVYMIF